jgi:L-iditol 2-dehydrogenase
MTGPWQFELRDVELPDAPPPGHVLLKVTACGVCGTDVFFAGVNRQMKPFGHEVAAVIEKIGANVVGIEVGRTVVLESAGFCGRCDLCRNGRVDLCNKGPGFWNQPAMGFSDRMICPAERCVPYEGLSPDVACLAEPAGVAYDMVRVAEIRLGDRVCVVGPGPIGLMAVAMARHAGAVRLACVGRSSGVKRLEVAKAFGAETHAIDGSLAEVKALARQFDHVLMTAPPEFIPPALSLLAYEGKLTFIGLAHGEASFTIHADDFHFRKLQIRSSFASPATYLPRALELIKTGIVPGSRLISHRFALADIRQAMDTARDAKATVLKIVVGSGG